MTKEQKILLLFVLAISASSATFYVVKTKSVASPVNNITQVSVVSDEKNPTPVTQNDSPAIEQAQAEAPKPTPTPSPAPSPAPSSKPTPTPKPVPASKTYKETLSYQTPDENVETITVTTTLDTAGKITDATFAYSAPSNRQSKEYLQSFAKDFKKSLVVGKSITTAHISRIGGASLVTGAFNNALASIAVKAKI